MTRTISGFRSDIRTIIRDVEATGITPHLTNAQLDQFTADAFRHLYAVRPDARYDEHGRLDDVVFPDPVDATGQTALANTSVTFDTRWYLGILYFAAARAYECDVTDSVNRELAANYFKQADAVFAM